MPRKSDLTFFVITLFYIVGVTNSINLIDGLDGLAAGLCIISISVLIFIVGSVGNYIILLLILSAILAFIRENGFPAKIFMGDSGSYFLGFTISTFYLMAYKSTIVSFTNSSKNKSTATTQFY